MTMDIDIKEELPEYEKGNGAPHFQADKIWLANIDINIYFRFLKMHVLSNPK